MQTFLPYDDFAKTARVLDYRRLGKQRIETKQLLNALLGRTKGWANHPAARMWRGYEGMLCLYGICMCKEWRSRGYKDAQLPILRDEYLPLFDVVERPVWLGLPQVHASHRAALLYKAPEHYHQFGWTESPELNYYWPV